MIPTTCHMPDLTPHCPPLVPSMLLVATFIGDGPLSRNAGLHRKTFVRLVDKAIAEYAKARVALIDQIDECRRTPDEMARTGRLISMFAFVDHMENCLNASRRLLASLDGLKNEQSVRGIERTDRRKIEVGGRDIREVRNTVEHMEQRIGRGDVHYGEPIALCLSEDGQAVSVAETSLRLDTLASVLRGLHSIGKGLLEVRACEQSAT